MHTTNRRRGPRSEIEKANRAARLSAVKGTFVFTTGLADAVQAATNGLLSVFGQPRNTVPFRRLFELIGRATGEAPLLVCQRVLPALQAFVDVNGAMTEGASAVLRAVIKHKGGMLGSAAASALAAEEAVNFIVGAE
jgi:hypothetical protein